MPYSFITRQLQLRIFTPVLLVLISILPILAQEDVFFITAKEEGVKYLVESKELFESEQWDKLEGILTEAEKNQSSLNNGYTILTFYFGGFDVEKYYTSEMPDDAWLVYLAKVKKWQQKHPESAFAKTAELAFWTAFAWKARGSGFAHQVEEEQWAVFRKRLQNADKVYQALKREYPKANVPCTEFYSAASTLALGAS